MNMLKTIWNGIIRENPVFVLCLGLAPVIGITHLAWNGLYLGLLTTIILVLTVLVKNVIQDLVPQETYLVLDVALLAIFTTVAYRLLAIYAPAVVVQLSIFLPLIIVNGFVLQRLSVSRKPVVAIFDAVGMGVGFTVAITLVGVVREFLGFGQIFGHQILNGEVMLFSLAATVPGGMIIFGLLLASVNALTGRGGKLSE